MWARSDQIDSVNTDNVVVLCCKVVSRKWNCWPRKNGIRQLNSKLVTTCKLQQKPYFLMCWLGCSPCKAIFSLFAFMMRFLILGDVSSVELEINQYMYIYI